MSNRVLTSGRSARRGPRGNLARIRRALERAGNVARRFASAEIGVRYKAADSPVTDARRALRLAVQSGVLRGEVADLLYRTGRSR